MKYTTTNAVVLGRTNYGEADRIVRLLSADLGKIGCMAKGVRKVNSKLAGGLELLGENEVTLIIGKSELYTVRSARNKVAWSNILQDFTRLHHAYDVLQFLDKTVDDGGGQELYPLLVSALEHLNLPTVHPDVLLLWFYLQSLQMLGHQPNLQTDVEGVPLSEESVYVFDFQEGTLIPASGVVTEGLMIPTHIKLWRLALVCDVATITAVGGVEQAATESLPILEKFIKYTFN